MQYLMNIEHVQIQLRKIKFKKYHLNFFKYYFVIQQKKKNVYCEIVVKI